MEVFTDNIKIDGNYYAFNRKVFLHYLMYCKYDLMTFIEETVLRVLEGGIAIEDMKYMIEEFDKRKLSEEDSERLIKVKEILKLHSDHKKYIKDRIKNN